MKSRFFMSILIAFLCSSFAYAKDINLYQQPDAKSKVVAKVKDQANVVIIFQPEKGDWIKVGDMTNGNVGWIKLDAMDEPTESAPEEKAKPTSALPYHKKVVKRADDGYGGQSVQVFEYQGTRKLSQAEVQAMMHRMEQRQRVMQHSLNRMMRSMMIDFDQFGLSEDGIDDPVFDLPEQASQQQATSQKQAQKTSWWQQVKSKLKSTH